MDMLLDPQTLISFFTLVALELVLGIDNVIFISILAGKLPKEQQEKARVVGLAIALISRIILLLGLSWVIGLVAPLFTFLSHEISGRDLILIIGGMFLMGKSTLEIHHKVSAEHHEDNKQVKTYPSLMAVLVQIFLLDVVFSLDSVITAVGMVDNVNIMIAAVLVSTAFMIFTSRPISRFVDTYPTIKVLALSFLLLIGMTLVAEGFDQHFSKSYIYFAMAFATFIEMINIRVARKSK